MEKRKDNKNMRRSERTVIKRKRMLLPDALCPKVCSRSNRSISTQTNCIRTDENTAFWDATP
jgi:hypothetical protein